MLTNQHWRLQLTCTGVEPHHQEITLHNMNRIMAEDYAGMLTGLSEWYIHSPVGTASPIGKCCICKAQVVYKLEELPNPN